MPKNAAQFRRLAKIGQHLRQLHLLQHPSIQTTPVQYPTDGPHPVTTNQYKPAPAPRPRSRPPLPQPMERQASSPATVADHLLGQGSATAGHGRIYINQTQYFANVPVVAWTAQIGGYHHTQKFLKDRKNQTLSRNDIHRYRHLIQALAQTLLPTIDQYPPGVWQRPRAACNIPPTHPMPEFVDQPHPKHPPPGQAAVLACHSGLRLYWRAPLRHTLTAAP